MADILSLSKARKTKARSKKQAAAAENLVRFGRSKAEKAFDAAQQKLTENRVDGAKRDT